MYSPAAHENPVLFDKVLIQGKPAIDFPERTLTPVSLVTRKLGKPDETIPVSNVLFAWWRYRNTAYMVATLAANSPAISTSLPRAATGR